MITYEISGRRYAERGFRNSSISMEVGVLQLFKMNKKMKGDSRKNQY